MPLHARGKSLASDDGARDSYSSDASADFLADFKRNIHTFTKATVRNRRKRILPGLAGNCTKGSFHQKVESRGPEAGYCANTTNKLG